MLAYLFEVSQISRLSFHNRSHTTEGSFLQLFTTIEGVSILQESNVVLGDAEKINSDMNTVRRTKDIGNIRNKVDLLVYQMSSSVDLSKSQFVVILVVKYVHKISIEGMNVVELWKFLNNLTQTIVEILLREFYFSSVKCTNTRYLVILVYNRRCLPLCL